MRAPLVAFAAGLLVGQANPAHGASPIYCAIYADGFAKIIRAAVDDSDVSRWERDRAYTTCLNKDENPTLPFIVGITDMPVEMQGTAPATKKLVDPDRLKSCRENYRSLRESDMTVVPRGSRGRRVPCPL